MADATGLYLGPPLHATVFSSRREMAIQALRRKDRCCRRRRGAESPPKGAVRHRVVLRTLSGQHGHARSRAKAGSRWWRTWHCCLTGKLAMSIGSPSTLVKWLRARMRAGRCGTNAINSECETICARPRNEEPFGG